MSCTSDGLCGTGGWSGPLPGDPDNNSILSATPAFGGIDVSWTYPTTNPHALAYTILYRSIIPEFNASLVYAIVSGGFFYDKINVNERYYYWIEFVSVNGTHGEVIGPATALARPRIEDLIEEMTDRIDLSMLSMSLRTEVSRIQPIHDEILLEVQDRLAAQLVLANSVATVDNLVDQAVTLIVNETTSRTEGDAALVTQVNAVAAAVEGSTALIIEEATVRAAADLALAAQVTLVESNLGDDIAAVEVALATEIGTVNGELTNIGALYTAKVTVNGLVGGFGIYNDATEVEAGFDVDTFWVGRTSGDKRKPFIIVGGETFIDQAVINELTFSKLKDEMGSFIVENGKVKAEFLEVDNLTAAHINVDSTTVDGRMTMTDDVICIYDSTDQLRVKLGKLS